MIKDQDNQYIIDTRLYERDDNNNSYVETCIDYDNIVHFFSHIVTQVGVSSSAVSYDWHPNNTLVDMVLDTYSYITNDYTDNVNINMIVFFQNYIYMDMNMPSLKIMINDNGEYIKTITDDNQIEIKASADMPQVVLQFFTYYDNESVEQDNTDFIVLISLQSFLCNWK